MDVRVYAQRGKRRSEAICEAMAAGINASGDNARIVFEDKYSGPVARAAVFYGFSANLPRVMEGYVAAGRPAIFIDLGYWGRVDGGRLDGYHRISVNARQPDAYFQRRPHDATRLALAGIEISPWRRSGNHILVAGMSTKHATSAGFKKQQWEREAIAQLRTVTRRPIKYRPKPSDSSCGPIEGTIFSPATETLELALANCHAVVTHHSNVAIDAAIAGVPSFSQAGVATAIGLQDLALIETPIYPDNREQWLADVAWCQWRPAEMRTGALWRHLKDEGLL